MSQTLDDLYKNTKKIDYYLYYFYFYIFITPWHFFNAQTSILSVILIIWAIIKYKDTMYNDFKAFFKFPPFTLLFTFIIYTYKSILWSDSIKDAFDFVNNYTKYYFLFIPVLLISMNKDTAINSIKLLTISFGLYAIYTIVIYFGLIHIVDSSINNPKGHLRYLIVSQYMSLGIFISFFIAYYTKIKKERIFFILVFLCTFFSLFINNSRTAQLSFIFVSIILGAVVFRRNFFNFKFLMVFFLLISSAVFVAYSNNKLAKYTKAYNEFHNTINKNTYNGSFGLRLYFNKVGIDILKDNLLFGTGPNDNRILLQEIQKNDSNYTSRIINHFHSEHIDKLTAYGLVGYMLLFSSIVLLIYHLRKKELYFSIGLSIFLTLFFNSFANKTLSVKPLNYVYLIFFILLVIIAYNKEKKIDEKI